MTGLEAFALPLLLTAIAFALVTASWRGPGTDSR